jgi:DNA replication and repair protein RecF
MFHVEHQYSDLAGRYKKTLIQRNSALRQSTSQLKVWDKELEVLGSEISRRMVNYTSLWNQAFKKMQTDLDVTKPIELQMKQGWKEGLSLQEAMERNRSVDIERGFTSTGPHRSDISILREGKLVKNIFSRGESKLTAVLMLLSQITISERMTGESPIVLIDDLHSELDNKRYHELISLISAQKLQTFITTLNIGDADISSVKEGFSVFHVEHGQLVDH